MKDNGIGRPSTYASIISTIANRGYAEILNKKFFPTDRGKLISAFLEKNAVQNFGKFMLQK